MNADTIFSIANLVAVAGWILLVFAPRFSLTRRLVLDGAIPLLLAGIYLVLIVAFFGRAEGGFDTLPNVMKLFTYQWAALAGWIHYLAFDLFVGAWEVRDAQSKGISHWFVVPCLLLTFLLGPIGLLLYRTIAFFAARKETGDAA